MYFFLRLCFSFFRIYCAAVRKAYQEDLPFQSGEAVQDQKTSVQRLVTQAAKCDVDLTVSADCLQSVWLVKPCTYVQCTVKIMFPTYHWCIKAPLDLIEIKEWTAEKAKKQEIVTQHHDKPHFHEVCSAFLFSL